MENKLEYSKEQIAQIEKYLEQPKIQEVLSKIGIYNINSTAQENLNSVKEYIYNFLRGKYIGAVSIDRFLNSLSFYAIKDDFERGYKNNEIINYKLLLPVAMTIDKERFGCRRERDIVGPDKKVYISKEAEGLKYPVSGKINAKDAKYNPIIANAFFKFLEEDCAEYMIAFEREPYYHILSENFLNKNQKLYGLDNEEFMGNKLTSDENGNIMHAQIIEAIEERAKEKFSNTKSEEEIMQICNRLKLKYAVQETIKKMIESIDENLRNTSIIITEDSNENAIDMDISPAYDLDLSLLLGEEVKRTDYSNNIMLRTTKDKKTDLRSIIIEFKEIPGYTEKIDYFLEKFNGNYMDEIFSIASNTSKMNFFQRDDVKNKFGTFIMKQVALFKECCKETKKENIKNL